MNSSKNEQRIWTFDLLRILLITLVLHIHIRLLIKNPSDVLSFFEYYPVPLFLTLSFYLTAKKWIEDNVSLTEVGSRVKRLLIPLVFWSLVGFITHPVLFTIPNIIIQLITGSVVNRPLYYLNLLIVFSIITYLFTYIRVPLRMIIFISIILVAFLLQWSGINFNFFNHFSMPLKYSYGRLIELIPYTIIGIFFGNFKTKLQNDKSLSLIILILSIIGFILSLYFKFSNGFSYQGLNLFFGSIIVFQILILSISKTTEYKFNLINLLGKYTFGVYLFHFTLLELIFNFFFTIKLFALQYPNVFLIFFLVFCFLLCIIFDKLTRNKFSYLIK